jgi:hypothetical protein
VGDIEVDGKTLGRLAFEAYRAEVGGSTFDDRPIPEWDELHGDRAQAHRGWEAAAAEVARWVRGSDIADRAFEEAYSGPRDFRDRPSRWQPLGVTAEPAQVGPVTLEAGARVYTRPVDDERAAQAAGSVPVEADDQAG